MTVRYASANPIYREVIPHDLTYATQETAIHQDPAWYVGDDGLLRAGDLLAVFREFFRQHSEHWVERFQYKEACPQLLLQAFLQRIINSGGRIEREYGLGRMRTDLLIVWPVPGSVGVKQKTVIECKVLHRGLEETLVEGLKQTRAYLDRCAVSEGHLVAVAPGGWSASSDWRRTPTVAPTGSRAADARTTDAGRSGLRLRSGREPADVERIYPNLPAGVAGLQDAGVVRRRRAPSAGGAVVAGTRRTSLPGAGARGALARPAAAFAAAVHRGGETAGAQALPAHGVPPPVPAALPRSTAAHRGGETGAAGSPMSGR